MDSRIVKPRPTTRHAALPIAQSAKTGFHTIVLAGLVAVGLAALALSMFSKSVAAGETSYRYKQANGTVLFTDIKIPSSEMKAASFRTLGARRSYRGDYGRPTATASCVGASGRLLDTRFAGIAETIELAASEAGVDALLIRAIARIESCYDATALSVAGAQGIMQLMPATARELGVSNSFDPVQNISGGTRYIASLLKRYDGDVELALAAYNAGPGAVDKHNGIPPYRETQRYVPSVLAQFKKFGKLQAARNIESR